MLKRIFDRVMERRAADLLQLIGDWLPHQGPILDLGSGTGHLAAMIDRERGLAVVTADVSDIHVVGPSPTLIADGSLPFENESFAAALLLFMLAYPRDAAGVLAEAARVTHGPLIVVQSLHSNRFGYAWLRVREFLWTIVAFYVSRFIGYVPRDAAFSMSTRRFFTAESLRGELATAGLRIRSRREQAVLPGNSLVVAALLVERDA